MGIRLRINRVVRGLLLPLSLLSLACAATPVPRDHYYRLGSASPATPSPTKLSGGITVETIQTDTLTGERPILWVAASRPAEITQHHYHHWAEEPGTALQHSLAQYLRAAGAADEIVTPELRIATDYRVTGRLTHFERVVDASGSKVVVEMRLSVLEPGPGGRGHDLTIARTYRAEVPASGSAVSDSIGAFDRAVAEIYERFASDLAAL